jgi:hypothetical protein
VGQSVIGPAASTSARSDRLAAWKRRVSIG